MGGATRPRHAGEVQDGSGVQDSRVAAPASQGEFAELPEEVWHRLEVQVAAFEQASADAAAPAITDFLLHPDPTHGQLLIELVHTDLEFRLRAGRPVRIEDYVGRFPELAVRPKMLSELFARHRRLRTRFGHTNPFEAAPDETQFSPNVNAETLPQPPAGSQSETLLFRNLHDDRELDFELRDTPPPADVPPGDPSQPSDANGLPDPAATVVPDSDGWLQDESDGDFSHGSADPAPRPFAHFELQKEVGNGTFGTVWKAWDTRLGRTVALKLCHRTTAGPYLFLREAAAAAKLSHPNIVAVHGDGVEGTTAYIVFEFIQGTNLKDWLSRHRDNLTPAQAATLLSTVARAVHYAHTQDVIHRDLKPANILVGDDDVLRIADFGLAKQRITGDDATRDGQLMGSVPYLSPEQVAGQNRTVNETTDTWALGVILYEMLAGRRPFTGTEAEILKNIPAAEPPPLRRQNPHVSRDLETVCLKALAKAPERRYQTAAELADDLDRVLRGEPICARRTGRIERVYKWTRRRPALAALVPLLVATAAGGGWHFSITDDTPPPGHVPVEITTDPPGAEIAFVPLDPASGEPRPQELVRPGKSPVRTFLRPGDYLVVAALDDTRFMEAPRWVPAPEVARPEGASSRNWRRDATGTVTLQEIKILDPALYAGMARLPGADRFVMGVAGSLSVPQHERRIPPFDIDTTEYSQQDFRDWVRRYRPDSRLLPNDPATADLAVNASWLMAAERLEKVGKRLPTEAEYEFAATAGGTRRFPWGDSDPPSVPDGRVFGAVGSPAWDRLDSVPPVYGLCSNVAEWTATRASHYPMTETDGRAIAALRPETFVVVRGGDERVIEGDPGTEAAHRNPRLRPFASRYDVRPGLGFRGVRSVRPRLNPADFEQVLTRGESPPRQQPRAAGLPTAPMSPPEYPAREPDE